MKGLEKKQMVGERVVTIRELTFGEIQLWERELEESIKHSTAGAADMMLMENFSVSDLLRMTDLTEAEIKDLTPSELDLVYQGCLEVNGRFFALRAHLIRPLKMAIECLGSIGTPADSSGWGTRMSSFIRGLSTLMRLKN